MRLPRATNRRTIGSGSAVITATSTVTIGTYTVRAGEAIGYSQLMEGLGLGGLNQALGAGNHGTLSGVSMFAERTGNANEFLLRAYNANGSNITVRYVIEGVSP